MNDEEMKNIEENESSLPKTEAKADEIVDGETETEVKKDSHLSHQKEKTGGRRGARAAKRKAAGLAVGQAAEAEVEEIVDEITETEGEVEGVSHDSPPVEKVEIKPGAQLAAKREEMGLSLEQIASRLKMTVRQVRELEADNYDTENGVAISRGFIRAYAKVLKMDPEPLVAVLSGGQKPGDRKLEKQEHTPKKRESKEKFTQNSQPFQAKRNRGKVFGYLVFIVVLIGALMVGRNMDWLAFDFKKKTDDATTINVETSSNTVSTEVSPPAVVMAEPGSTQQAPQDGTVVPGPGDTPPGNSPVNAANPGEISPVEDALIIYFRGQTWVQVLRADSSIMYEYRGNVGEIQKLEIKEPVTLVVGDAPGVEVNFRGVRVELHTTEGTTAKANLK